MAGFELIDAYDTLNTGRIALNHMYSGMTIYWSGGTGTNSIIRNNNEQNLKNRATASNSWAGGQANSSSSSFALTLWGSGNTATTQFSTVLNGRENVTTSASKGFSTVLNGVNNNTLGNHVLITHGTDNIINDGHYSSIIGGYSNNIDSASFASLIGGSGNTIIGGGINKHQVIIGGYGNTIEDQGHCAIIVGGAFNRINNTYGVVLGGIGNTSEGIGSISMGGGALANQNFTLSIGGILTSTSDPSNNTISLFGDTGVGHAEGGFFTGPADIAEMFEFADGNPNNEDRRGLFVSITSGGKIEVGNTNIIGVVSANPGYIGDSAELKWSGVYLKDKFGGKIIDNYKMFSWTNRKKQTFRVFESENGIQYTEHPSPGNPSGIIYEGDSIPQDANISIIKIPRINPEFNPNNEYIPRSKRKEWKPIGLLGKINVKTSEEINGTHVDADENGFAKNGTKYPVIETVKPFSDGYGIVKIFFK